MEFPEGPKPLESLARLALDEIEAAAAADRKIDDAEVVDEIAAVIHDRWRQDNGDNGIPESKNKPYGELEENEKEEFRIVVAKAGEAFQYRLEK